MTPREITHLRLPICIIGREFVQGQDGRTSSGFFVVETRGMPRSNVRHNDLLVGTDVVGATPGLTVRSADATAQLKSYLQKVWQRYHKPIWLTEYALIKFASGGGQSSGQQNAGLSAHLMQSGWGKTVLIIAGLTIAIIGGYHIYKGGTKNFLDDLKVSGGRVCPLRRSGPRKEPVTKVFHQNVSCELVAVKTS